MFWNHRVMRRTMHGEEELFVVEVYYEDKDNHILGWTEKEEVWGADLDEIRNTLTWMLEALDKPILDEAELLAQAEQARAEGRDPIFDPEEETFGPFQTIDEIMAFLEEDDGSS